MKYNVRVEDKQKEGVLFSDMKDGEIGVVLDNGDYQGRVVQRHYDTVISIGFPSGNRWSHADSVTLRVRLLQPGDKILL